MTARVVGSVTFNILERAEPCEVCGSGVVTALIEDLDGATRQAFWSGNVEHTPKRCAAARAEAEPR